MKRIYIVIVIIVLISLVSVSALFEQCIIAGEDTEAGQLIEESAKEDNGENEGGRLRQIDYLVAFFEVGIDENSMHFEHRVADIYTVGPDGNNRKLVFSDLNEKYDLGRIYELSPYGRKISCGFVEGGRGAYSAMKVIDADTGELTTAVEFDYTETESMELMEDIYGESVWSHDGKKIVFETVLNPYSGNLYDGGISIVDIDTGDILDVSLQAGDLAGEDTLITPVLFSLDDTRLFCILYNYYPKTENGDVLGYFSRSEKLLSVDISSGEVNLILDIGQFNNGEMNFSNFNIFTQGDSLIFQVLGDFEEDGDIWACSSDGSGLLQVTSDTSLREQQPSILDMPGSIGDLTYVGVERYGTIPNQFNSGDIYTISIDGSGQNRITDYGIGAAEPVFSPDGRYIAFMHYEYDSNMEYVTGNNIEVYNMETGEIKIVASSSSILDLIGWVPEN